MLALLYLILPAVLVAPSRFRPELAPRLITVMVFVWSIRLALHLGARVAAHHPDEDVRYARLRNEWGEGANRRMFGFFQLRGVWQVVLSLPFALVVLNQQTELGPWHMAGIAVWIAGILGESTADLQLTAFRSKPRNRGRVCQTGLWSYSRHPNYFFEWLIWIGYALFALSGPWGWLGLIAPILMGHFLVNVTGIPIAEKLSVRSKGDAYREYQRTTSAFIPWLKKRTVPQ